MDRLTVYKNARVGGILIDLTVCDGKCADIGKTAREGMDLGGLDVFPGLIDIQRARAWILAGWMSFPA